MCIRDRKGVGHLVKTGVDLGRTARPDLVVGICEMCIRDRLYAVVIEKKNDMERYFEEGNYRLYLQELSSLRAPIDNCLDNVLIMSEDERLRENRVKLLGVVSDMFTKFADFSYILPLLGKL